MANPLRRVMRCSVYVPLNTGNVERKDKKSGNGHVGKCGVLIHTASYELRHRRVFLFLHTEDCYSISLKRWSHFGDRGF